MKFDPKTLPDDVQYLDQREYQALRTRANAFMNRNWWWVCLGLFAGGWKLGAMLHWPRWPF